MRIFLSYASQRRPVAEELATELRALGHRVFLDRDDLPSGQAFDARIRRQIEASDLFLFLISPESVEIGRYTRTELAVARSLWPHPAGRVLPVVVAATPQAEWPSYLRAVTVFEPLDDVVKETVIEVERLRRRRWPSLFLRRTAAVAASVAVVAVVVFVLASRRDSRPPAAFEIYGNHPYPAWGETVSMQLVNVRPQALSAYSCRIIELPGALNIAEIEHDPRCADIRVVLAEGPFVDAYGKAFERLGSQRWERARLEVIDNAGEIAWSGEIRIAVANAMSLDHFNLAGLPGEGGTGLQRRYEPRYGTAYSTRVEYRGRALSEGFVCTLTRSLFGSFKAADLVQTGSCSFDLRPAERRSKSQLGGAGEATIHIAHLESGWSLDLQVAFVFAQL